MVALSDRLASLTAPKQAEPSYPVLPVVGEDGQTNVPGIYAAGDIVDYDGKLDLIATGFAEAAIAVNQAVHFVDPTARVNPGHSTNLKVFKED